ncbi:2'-5'-oligoadenylate synthase-like protein 1, partial [Chiloscyllium plagiosum]|uniref:2'-5'-oligoadenylate synthase-like protein 1 n=1 Tax=Chiloscyllium plagiosum TaxID=36176 RepID=UPI001CB84C67
LTECARSIANKISDINITLVSNSNIPPKSLSFALKSKKKYSDSVKFDILPAFDALEGSSNGNTAHLRLIKFVSENGDPCGEFSACFTELQRNFVKQRNAKLKDLIRLLKYWYKEYVKPRESELAPGQRLRAKYAVELLTIYAWEQGNGTERFVTAEGFRTVLELICNYQNLHIYWTDRYNVNNQDIVNFLRKKLCGSRPIILDPADPTNNVASSDGWNVMVKEAKKCLSSSCVSGVQAWKVQPMAQFEITVISLNGSSLPLMANSDTNILMIKNQIQQNWGIPVHQQRLMVNETILNGGKTLLDSGIFFDAKLHLLVTNSMEIFVRHPNGHNRKINVSPTDKVLSLKNEIQNLEGISPSQYYLTFQSQTLEDSHTLEYYGIDQHCTIGINLRLRGGKAS